MNLKEVKNYSMTNKSQAIKKNCRDCNGSPKEVTLCPTILCEFWPHRFGYSIRSKQFRQRMALAKKNYLEEYKEVAKLVRETLLEQPSTPKNTQIRMFFEEDFED